MTNKAMQTLADRVNARLDATQPDQRPFTAALPNQFRVQSVTPMMGRFLEATLANGHQQPVPATEAEAWLKGGAR